MAIRFKTVILCDYVTQDVNGKYVLAGIYSGNITLISFPAALHLMLYVEFEADTPGNYQIKTELQFGDYGTVAGMVDASGVDPAVPSVFTMEGVRIEIPGPCYAEFRATVDDGNAEVLLRKSIGLRSNA